MEIDATINYCRNLHGKLLGFVFELEHNPGKTLPGSGSDPYPQKPKPEQRPGLGFHWVGTRAICGIQPEPGMTFPHR